ncbi:MAG: iron-sulfur cluster assembly accessory protein [Chloroflexi bacterium]|nr:iron-sulfur cluster assembly accessory protein [Chloroflexota bacterium]MCY3958845.1 iron-sulfur cluster assembly accessory protein [Chloroflexota bacterium]
MATGDMLELMGLPLAEAPILRVQPSAAAEFDRMRTKRNRPDAVLRVRVIVDSGCGDFRYAMGIEPGPRDGDQSIPAHGVTVVVDQESADLLRGSTLEYSDSLMDGGFKVLNPRAQSVCGCGQSFSLTGREITSEHVRGGLGAVDSA